MEVTLRGKLAERDRMADSLEAELQGRRDHVQRIVARLDRSVALCWWGAIVFAGLASVLGFVAEVPEVRDRLAVEPWMVSALAAVSGGFELIRRKTSWRIKSNLYYLHRVEVDNLLYKLRYELSSPATPAQIASVSQEYRERYTAWADQFRKVLEYIDGQAVDDRS